MYTYVYVRSDAGCTWTQFPYHSIPCHEFSEALFWGTWIVGDLGWQPSWGRILGEETPNRDNYGAVAGLQWCSGGRCQSHLFEAPPANDSPGDVCWLCLRLMPWRWWIFRTKCGSIPFGIQRLIRLYPGQTVCADAKTRWFFSCCWTFAICIPSFTARLSNIKQT